mmetsp:Transcript_661/g.1436  ORF Transcript_661/g.1436 Transcript_661/m.1436 type:complete len:257 (-) Transcript_661:522-1292(-)
MQELAVFGHLPARLARGSGQVAAAQLGDGAVLVQGLVGSEPASHLVRLDAERGGHVKGALAERGPQRKVAARLAEGVHRGFQHEGAGVDGVDRALAQQAQQVLVVLGTEQRLEAFRLQVGANGRAAQQSHPQGSELVEAERGPRRQRVEAIADHHQRHQPLKTGLALGRAHQRKDAVVPALLDHAHGTRPGHIAHPARAAKLAGHGHRQVMRIALRAARGGPRKGRQISGHPFHAGGGMSGRHGQSGGSQQATATK